VLYGLLGGNGGSFTSPLTGPQMQSKLKDALMTTAVVLATIYVLNKVSFTRNVVQTALA